MKKENAIYSLKREYQKNLFTCYDYIKNNHKTIDYYESKNMILNIFNYYVQAFSIKTGINKDMDHDINILIINIIDLYNNINNSIDNIYYNMY